MAKTTRLDDCCDKWEEMLQPPSIIEDCKLVGAKKYPLNFCPWCGHPKTPRDEDIQRQLDEAKRRYKEEVARVDKWIRDATQRICELEKRAEYDDEVRRNVQESSE